MKGHLVSGLLRHGPLLWMIVEQHYYPMRKHSCTSHRSLLSVKDDEAICKRMGRIPEKTELTSTEEQFSSLRSLGDLS
jgi:hypothetical protein